MFFRVSFVNLDQQHCFLLQTLLHATALLFVVFFVASGLLRQMWNVEKNTAGTIGSPAVLFCR